MLVRGIPCNVIMARADARAVDRQVVNDLKASIAKMGMIHPILVRPKKIWMASQWVDGYELIAGRHRLHAAQEMGLSEIDATIVELGDVDAELAMIGENLHRNDLTREERDRAIRRMGELMGVHIQSRQNDPIESKRDDGRGHRPQGIASRIAEQTGLSKRTVQRALNPPDVAAVKPVDAPTKDEQDEQAYWRMWARMSPSARDRVLRQHASHGHFHARAA